MMPLPCSSLGSHLYLLEPPALSCPVMASQDFSRVGAGVLFQALGGLTACPGHLLTTALGTKSSAFWFLFAVVRHSMGSTQEHPGWKMRFGVSFPAGMLNSPTWTRTGVGSAACILPEADIGNTGREHGQLAGNFGLGATNG